MSERSIDDLVDEDSTLIEELIESERAEKAKFQQALEYFRENGIYKGNFDQSVADEFFGSNLYNQHIGYVNIELLPDVKNTAFRWCSTDRYHRLSLESQKEFPELKGKVFSEEVDDDECFTYYVCQRCEFEDYFYGYILLPLKDGRFWMTYFSA
jgi:hypothetical protein